MTPPPPRDDEGELNADERTLRLAAPEVTADKLDRFIRYRRRYVESLRAGDPGWAERVPGVQAEIGLSARDAAALEALSRDFCGRRWADRQLSRRMAELQQLPAPTERDTQKLENVTKELRQRDTVASLARRYGKGAIDLLLAREEELLELHQEVEALLRSHGS